MLTLPEPLRAGDKVRLIAPSGPFERQPFLDGVQMIRDAGLTPEYDEWIFARHRFLAGDDKRRQAEIDAALASGVKALWMARGGYGAARLLGHTSVAAVQAHKPWLVGFSDATALHALWARAGVGSLHGANATTLPSWSEAARRELFDLLMTSSVREHRGLSLRSGPVAYGQLTGGNLTVLASLVGTGALPSYAGCVVLLEDIGERPYRLDRELTQLLQAGVFDGVRGFVIGQLTGCKEPNDASYTALDVIAERLATLHVPILAELALGHEPSSRGVLFGGYAELDTENARLRVAPRRSLLEAQS